MKTACNSKLLTVTQVTAGWDCAKGNITICLPCSFTVFPRYVLLETAQIFKFPNTVWYFSLLAGKSYILHFGHKIVQEKHNINKKWVMPNSH